MTTTNLAPSRRRRNPAIPAPPPRPLRARSEAAHAGIKLYELEGDLRALAVRVASTRGVPAEHNQVLSSIAELLRKAKRPRRVLRQAARSPAPGNGGGQ